MVCVSQLRLAYPTRRRVERLAEPEAMAPFSEMAYQGLVNAMGYSYEKTPL